MMEELMGLKSLMPIGRTRDVARREWNPFDGLQREVERLFDDFSRGYATPRTQDLTPSIDVTETDKEVEITAELPGLEEKDVQVNVADNLLTIRGEKKAEREDKNKDYHVVERSYGSFSRTLELPESVDADAIQATMSKGVLKVVVPKPAPAQVKKVSIKSAA